MNGECVTERVLRAALKYGVADACFQQAEESQPSSDDPNWLPNYSKWSKEVFTPAIDHRNAALDELLAACAAYAAASGRRTTPSV